jgi:cytochrome c556
MRFVALAGIALCALMPGQLAFADIDTSDVDAYLMQDMENALKSLEPVLTAGNTESALADAQVLRDGLKYTYDYFVGKGADDAVKIAADGQAAVERVFGALEKKDLDAAIAAARDTAQNCKACHDTYKR